MGDTVTAANTNVEEESLDEDCQRICYNNKVLKLDIVHIYSSKLISPAKPHLYCLQGKTYRFVIITGIVVGVENQGTARATLFVDDGSSVIPCLMYENEQLKEYRTKYERLLANALDENNCQCKKTDGCTNSNHQFTHKFVEKFLVDCKPILDVYRSHDSFNYGQYVTIIGKVADLRERLIYVLSICLEQDITIEKNVND